MHAGDPRKRNLDLVLPAGREPQRFGADAVELAVEHLVVGQVDPDVGPSAAGAFGSTASLASVCDVALVLTLAAWPSS